MAHLGTGETDESWRVPAYGTDEEDAQELERWNEGYNEFEQDYETDASGNCFSDADPGL